MSLLGRVVGAALLDEWDRRKEDVTLDSFGGLGPGCDWPCTRFSSLSVRA